MADHERAWAEGLAQEHAHQGELLAVVRGEIGAFARECSAALSALDGVSGGLGAFAFAVSAGTTAHEHANLALDVGRRFRHLRAGEKGEEAELYKELGGEGNLSERAVGQARNALKADPKRNDRELLAAVVSAAGVRSQIESILGPAPVAVLAGLVPLAQRLPALARISGKEAEPAAGRLASVLEAAGSSDDDTSGVAAAASLADSLREAAAHARGAAKAVEEGKLRAAVREAREQLSSDLGGLRSVLTSAEGAVEEWMRDRERDHAELTAEVEAKLDRLERVGAWLEQIVPRLQLVGRGLSAAEKARTLDNQLDPGGQVTAEAARLTLLLTLAGVWGPTLGGGRPVAPRRASAFPRNRRVALGAAALLLAGAGAGLGAWAATSGGSSHPAAPPGRSILPGPTNTTATVNSTPAPTNTTAVIPVRVKIAHGPKRGQFILSYSSRVPLKTIIYITNHGTTSPGTRACTAKHYPAKRINCAVPPSARTKGSVPFYPEPPSKTPGGTVTFLDTSGHTVGPLSVSFTG